jgi:3-hydroxymyristoyl/3-hydroxydecanoyl-(acyl carrier protein) dehydratase
VRYVLIDRITALERGHALTAIKNVSLSDGMVMRLAPGVSALPASMVLEAMAQAAGLLVIASTSQPAQPVLAHGDAVAGDRIVLRAELDELRSQGARAHVTASVDERLIAEAAIYLGLMPIEGEDSDDRLALVRERLADTFPEWFSSVTASVGR